MTDNTRDDILDTRDEDRLPWLEAVEDEDKDDQVSTTKLIGFAIAALLAIGAVIGGLMLLRSGTPTPQGDGKLIAAAPGDYKVKPDAPGGMKVEGQGDSAFAASEGAEPKGKIDTAAAPEAPITGGKAAPAPATAAAPAKATATAAVPATGGRLVAPPPPRPVATAVANAPEGSTVQLGAYNSEAIANGAWTRMTKRFAYLGSAQKSVEVAQVNGRTVYRLRAVAPGQAADICGKLKVAGEACLIVN
ncbi:MAG: SPOR domain-containing protein [Sphingomonadaceae bacterium]